MMPNVTREKDSRHGASAELALDRVRSANGGLELLLQRAGHRVVRRYWPRLIVV
jgi:hypothetical protein